MDLICTCCGEPWDTDYVLHDAEPEDFLRIGGLIDACPCCRGKPPPDQRPEERMRLDQMATLGELLGEDIDGLAALLDDLMLL